MKFNKYSSFRGFSMDGLLMPINAFLFKFSLKFNHNGIKFFVWMILQDICIVQHGTGENLRELYGRARLDRYFKKKTKVVYCLQSLVGQ